VLQLKGIPNNLELCKAIAGSEAFAAGRTTTGFLTDFSFSPHAAEIIAPGMNTTVQVRTPALLAWIIYRHSLHMKLLLHRDEHHNSSSDRVYS
jgi:hypothetical protein